MTKPRADCIIKKMVSALGTSSIAFYAAAAGLALLFAVVFVVALFWKKRPRRAVHRFVTALCVIGMIVSIVAAAFAVINRYRIWGISWLVAGNKLCMIFRGRQLLSVPYIGRAVAIFDALEFTGVVVPCVVFMLGLWAAIALAVKTVPAGKAKKQKKNKEVSAPATARENDIPQESDTPQSESGSLPEEESVAPASERVQEEVPQPQTKEIPSYAAHTIVDEIDRLVTGSDNAASLDGIDDALQRAIREGYALTQTLNGDADELADEVLPPEDDAPQAEENAPKEAESAVEEPRVQQEGSEAEPEEEDELPENIAADEKEETVQLTEAPEIVQRTIDARREKKVISVEEAENMPEEKQPSPARTRVRTIIRRPPAKSMAEIEERGSAMRVAQEKKASPKPVETPPAPKADKPQPAAKSVEAKEGGLPLTRKYIILNRRNAAAVFNDYLNSKREREKEELTGSLNTIIIK